jgi:glucan exporter ATP-binding protein
MEFLRTYLRVILTLREARATALALVAANLLVAGLQFVDPLLFGRVIELLTRSASMEKAALWREAAVLLGLWAAIGLAGIVASMVSSLHAERMAHRNRLEAMRRYFGHVLTLPPEFHGDAHSGRLMKIMLGGADAMFGLWLAFFRDHLATFVAALVLLPLTLFLNWQLALLLIALTALFCVATILVIAHTEEGQQRAQRFQVQLAGTAQDALANVTVMQSFTRLAAEQKLFGQIVQQVIAHQFPVLTWWAVVHVLTRAASTITVIAIVVLGTYLHVNGQASVGEIVTFMGLAVLLIGRLEGAMIFCSQLFAEIPGLRDFFAVLDAQSTVPERIGAPALAVPRGEVVFDDVGFAYPNGETVLDAVSFTAPPGSVVALVGHTGAGKSTAMALLQRMWDPIQGHIAIDGQDLRDVELESLRRNIGVVFQEAMLLNRSIRENLLVGKPDATQAEIEAACVMADAHGFILRQKDGYDTMVGERGATLSGGQRQRLAIARALLKDPPILVLDEATSALDAATEARVAAALRRLMVGRTTFIIAHRLSTVRDADMILVFDQGRVAERGRFAELVAARGTFADLVATQLAPA